MSKKTNQDIKQLRAVGHKLKPVVTIAGNGLTDGVCAELERALGDHELIKVKLAAGSRETRAALAREICDRTRAELVQAIGNVVVILRRSARPDPRLSNLIRAL
ncbi:MAG: YhbY family RNA-binding protein [Gammaproteobacteria bacterium]|jgi:RNA-binding protein|nr:YhbY family RNA-binding protein [Gammaproteobacteria bacterium]MDH5171229.1 YhbY family RNA-binding protein [Gammaproteobacteria bacterium]